MKDNLTYNEIMLLGHPYNDEIQHIIIYNWYMVCTVCKSIVQSNITNVSKRLVFNHEHLKCAIQLANTPLTNTHDKVPEQ